MTKEILIGVLLLALVGCQPTTKKSRPNYGEIKVAGAMRNVMWKGELAGSIQLDTLGNKKGLFGLGPESYLTGELLIKDGQIYVSRVSSDSSMLVEKVNNVSAPFFVYGYVNEWKAMALPKDIKTLQQLETFIDSSTNDQKRPFAFKLTGQITRASFHVLHLPKGSNVSSPDDAHQGQINFKLLNEEVELIGFFSTEHKGVFTHHDSNLHIHIMTKDESQMGHLDEVEFSSMTIYFPVN